MRLGAAIPPFMLAALTCGCQPACVLDASSELPDEWVRFDSADMRITVYHPAAWEPVRYGMENVDIEEVDGDGWLEIYMLSDETSDLPDMPYQTGMSSEGVLETVADLLASRSAMTFSEAETLLTQAGEAAAARGYDTEYDEYVYIAALALGDRALICLGWGYERNTWEEEYIPIYEEIVRSINELEE